MTVESESVDKIPSKEECVAQVLMGTISVRAVRSGSGYSAVSYICPACLTEQSYLNELTRADLLGTWCIHCGLSFVIAAIEEVDNI